MVNSKGRFNDVIPWTVVLFILLILGTNTYLETRIKEESNPIPQPYLLSGGVNIEIGLHTNGYKDRVGNDFTFVHFNVYIDEDFSWSNVTGDYYMIYLGVLFSHEDTDTHVLQNLRLTLTKENASLITIDVPYRFVLDPNFPKLKGNIFVHVPQRDYLMSYSVALGGIYANGSGGFSSSSPTHLQFQEIDNTIIFFEWIYLGSINYDRPNPYVTIVFVDPLWLSLKIIILMTLTVFVGYKIKKISNSN